MKGRKRFWLWSLKNALNFEIVFVKLVLEFLRHDIVMTMDDGTVNSCTMWEILILIFTDEVYHVQNVVGEDKYLITYPNVKFSKEMDRRNFGFLIIFVFDFQEFLYSNWKEKSMWGNFPWLINIVCYWHMLFFILHCWKPPKKRNFYKTFIRHCNLLSFYVSQVIWIFLFDSISCYKNN